MLSRSSITKLSTKFTTHNFCRTMITAQAAMFSQHGEPKDALFTHKYEIDDENIPDGKIIVKTLASPVNPSDINQVQGVYPSQPEKTTSLGTSEPSAVGGNEGLFEVIAIGKDVKGFQVGDWCIPSQVNFGTWRTHALASETEMTKLNNPDQSIAAGGKKGLTLNEGATISVNPLTAYLMLTHYVKLTPGKDWFIQNGGNSAVGKYATQIGKLLGFNSISVVRDRDNLDELITEMKQEYGATQVITEEQNSSKDFGAEIKKWTKETDGQIKLGLNCVGGKNSTGVARKLAPNGILLTYGGMSMQPVSIPTSLYIFKNITSAGFWVTQLLKNNQELKAKTLNQIVQWYESGELKSAPSVETKFDGSDIAEFYKNAVANSKSGKQLIVYK